MAVWNPTLANLTLMALGSSAPAILLSLIETATTLGSTPGELGPSTIVGSAAFNLLVISAVSIVSVGPETKKIEGVGVFVITATASLFAYIWMFLCLAVFSEDEIEIWEAVVTLVFFFILITAAFIADKIKSCMDKKKGKNPENLEDIFDHDEFIRIMKITNSVDKEVSEEDAEKLRNMKEVLKDKFDTDDVSKIDPHLLKDLGKPASVVPRIQYRLQVGNALTGKKDLVVYKGMVYSAEEKMAKDMKGLHRNKHVGFKCLHYSVTEGAGTLKVEILHHSKEAFSCGIRTKDDTANAGEDYEAVDKRLDFKANEKNKTIEVAIVDDNEWEPDEDFLIELYDLDTEDRLDGADTETRVTIIDDDEPGTLSFAQRSVKVTNKMDKVKVRVVRQNGCDGTVKVKYSMEDGNGDVDDAIPSRHYHAKGGELVFFHGEIEKYIDVKMIKDNIKDTDIL